MTNSWQDPEAAAEWDGALGHDLPTRAEQVDVLLSLLATAEIGDGAVLDLGVGSGLIAERVLAEFPQARLVGVDFSRAMLELASKRLERFAGRVELVQHDLAKVTSLVVPLAEYRAAFSVQTLHHLTDHEKAKAYAWSADVLAPGGLLVVADQVAFPELLFEQWRALWRKLDLETPRSHADYLAGLAQEGDRPARLEDQLSWMRNAGLAAVCFHAYANRAVLVGRTSR